MTESNWPVNGPVQKPSNNAPATRGRLGWGWALGAIVLGIVTGVAGTIMHLNSTWTGTFGIPWGVVLSLVIAWLAQRWIGLRTATILAPGITGISQYLTLSVLIGFNPNGNMFGIPITEQTWEFLPHLVIASLAWHLGVIVITIITVIHTARKIKQANSPPHTSIPGGEHHPAANQNH